MYFVHCPCVILASYACYLFLILLFNSIHSSICEWVLLLFLLPQPIIDLKKPKLKQTVVRRRLFAKDRPTYDANIGLATPHKPAWTTSGHSLALGKFIKLMVTKCRDASVPSNLLVLRVIFFFSLLIFQYDSLLNHSDFFPTLTSNAARLAQLQQNPPKFGK